MDAYRVEGLNAHEMVVIEATEEKRRKSKDSGSDKELLYLSQQESFQVNSLE